MLDNAITIKPKRQMSVQFSGGEPTLSPYFLDAVRYAREVGYTSGRRPPMASSSPRAPSSAARRPRPACATPTCSSTASQCRQPAPQGREPVRRESCRAIENLYAKASISSRSSPSSTASTTSRWAASSNLRSTIQEDSFPFFSAGFLHRPRRSRHRRAPRRPALHALAPGARREEPNRPGRAGRDWFPISFMSTFSDWSDLVHGPQADWAS